MEEPTRIEVPPPPSRRMRQRVMLPLAMAVVIASAAFVGRTDGEPQVCGRTHSLLVDDHEPTRDCAAVHSAKRLARLGEFEGALEVQLEDDLERRATRARWRRMLIRQHRAEGRYAQAALVTRAALEEEGSLGREQLRLALALRGFEASAREEARRRGGRVLRRIPDSAEVRRNLGETYWERGVAKLKIGEYVGGMLDQVRALELDASHWDEVCQRLLPSPACRFVSWSRLVDAVNEQVVLRPLDPGPLFWRAMIRCAQFFEAGPRGQQRPRGYSAGCIDLALADLHVARRLSPTHASVGRLGALLADLRAKVALPPRVPAPARRTVCKVTGAEYCPESSGACFER